MSSQWKHRTGFICAAYLALVVLGGAGPAQALIGSADSPLFSLNTLWATGVADNPNLPRSDRLSGCYPNPFNPKTTIGYELTQTTTVSLRIYDLQGHLIRILVNAKLLPAGAHQVAWDGRDEQGNQAAAGIYLYRLVTDEFSGAKHMTLLK